MMRMALGSQTGEVEAQPPIVLLLNGPESPFSTERWMTYAPRSKSLTGRQALLRGFANMTEMLKSGYILCLPM